MMMEITFQFYIFRKILFQKIPWEIYKIIFYFNENYIKLQDDIAAIYSL